MKAYPIAAGRSGILATVLLCATIGTAAAQWLSLPLHGTPRTADGQHRSRPASMFYGLGP